MSKMPKNTFLSVPIIDKKGIIKSKISAQNLFNYVFSMYNEVKGNFSIKGQSNFTEYFSFTKKKFFNIKRGLIQQIKRKFRKLYMSIRDKERLILNKNFKQESCMRIMVFFEQQSKKDKIFLGRKIDLNDKNLGCDKSCLTIEKTFSVIQIQFLFTFLNVSHVFVTDEGKLIGVITKEDFVQKTEK
jgi:CBS domain-containing protein